MLEKVLKNQACARVAETGIPSFERNHRLLAEYAHVSGKLNSSSGGDIFIFLPYIESMKHRTPPDDWKKATEAIISAAEKVFKDNHIILPSPPFPELFEPYRECLEKIAMEGMPFISTCTGFCSLPGMEEDVHGGRRYIQECSGAGRRPHLADEIVTAVGLSPENGSR